MREFQRLGPSLFTRKGDVKVAEEWLDQVTQMFDTLDIQEDPLRVSLAAYQLREDARHWWCQASTTVERNWEAFQDAFCE